MNIYKDFVGHLPRKKLLIWAVPLLLVVGTEITTTALIPYSRKLVMDSLVELNWHSFVICIGLSFLNYAFLSGAQGVKTWLSGKVSFLGRKALMETVKDHWVARDGTTTVSNPDARLNDDSRIATEMGLQVTRELFISAIIVVSLITTIIKWPILLIAAIAYSTISILLASLFKNPMTRAKYNLSDSEGRHRLSLSKIYLKQNDQTSADRWVDLETAYHRYIDTNRNYTLFNALQTALMITVPFLIMAPDLFAGKVTLGDVTQGTLTFDLLVINAAIWVNMYPIVIEARTALIRVKEFYNEIHCKESE